jgi:hypothetical protein
MGCIFMPAKKGQKFKHYPESVKVEAVRLTYLEIKILKVNLK